MSDGGSRGPQVAANMAALHEQTYDETADYAHGSPHLRHDNVRGLVTETVRELVLDRLDRTGSCRVLEVGAGHGAFSDHISALGADLVVTEMSQASLLRLQARLKHNPRVEFLYDGDGEEIFRASGRFDLIVCISVLHHIPDYMGWVLRSLSMLNPGAHFASFQDPLFYPRQSSTALRLDRAAYLAWRIRQGNLRRGLATQLRRSRHTYDRSCPGDMVEYHVVRQGVDEASITSALRPSFAVVELSTYWSTPGVLLQRLGTGLGRHNTFSIVARDFRRRAE